MARKKNLRFGFCIEPTFNRGRSFSVTFSVNRVIKSTLVTTQNEARAKALHAEAKSVMTQPANALDNMIKALSMHPWLNTEKENVRLEAAKLFKAHS